MGFISDLFGSGNQTQGQQVDVYGDKDFYANQLLKAQKMADQGWYEMEGTRNQNQGLIQALQAQTRGEGPTVAQNQLNEATAKNIKRGAAMAASSKGIDPAMAARIGVDATAEANQMAAGQGATLRAQEQLGAYGQLGNALNSQMNAQLGLMGAANQRGSIYGGLHNQSHLGAQGLTAGANEQNSGYAQKRVDGLLGALGSAGKMAVGAYSGGEIGLADGGVVGVNPHAQSFANAVLEIPRFGSGKHGATEKSGDGMKDLSSSSTEQLKKLFSGSAPMASDSMVTAGPGVIPPAPMAHGGKAKGQGLVAGDSPKNDIVPAMLSPGEIVIPRSITQSPDAAEKAKAFVEAIKNKKGKK